MPYPVQNKRTKKYILANQKSRVINNSYYQCHRFDNHYTAENKSNPLQN